MYIHAKLTQLNTHRSYSMNFFPCFLCWLDKGLIMGALVAVYPPVSTA